MDQTKTDADEAGLRRSHNSDAVSIAISSFCIGTNMMLLVRTGRLGEVVIMVLVFSAIWFVCDIVLPHLTSAPTQKDSA